jgi:hypothetical protein
VREQALKTGAMEWVTKSGDWNVLFCLADEAAKRRTSNDMRLEPEHPDGPSDVRGPHV